MTARSLSKAIVGIVSATVAIAMFAATYVSRAATEKLLRPPLAALPRADSAPAQTGTHHRTISSEPMGVWSAPEESIDIFVHAAMLNTGKVLLWGVLQGANDSPPPYTPAQLYDPVADTMTDVSTSTQVDIVCGGQSIMPDGRIMVTGGTEIPLVSGGGGVVNTSFFDPKTETWSQGASMNYPRWYPTNIELGTGDTLVTSGHDQSGLHAVNQNETYSSTTNVWTVLPPSANNPNSGNNYLYPRMELLPNGNVFMSAPDQQGEVLNLTTNKWTAVGVMNFGPRYYAGQVLLPNSYTAFVVGGTPSNADGGGTTPTATTETIDLSAAKPVFTYGPSMNIARYNQTTLYLADGTVMVVGGNSGPGHYENPVFAAEIYDPATQQWSLMASQIGVRAYHSVSILLADGRVISTGSTSNTTYNHYYEIFSPPYLFNGTRPTITDSPASVTYGQQFTITTPDASEISSVALVMPGATTHANDMQQRYVPLTFTVGSGSLTATAPSSGNWAPPGYYMLVIVNENGVPSVMPFVQLSSGT